MMNKAKFSYQKMTIITLLVLGLSFIAFEGGHALKDYYNQKNANEQLMKNIYKDQLLKKSKPAPSDNF